MRLTRGDLVLLGTLVLICLGLRFALGAGLDRSRAEVVVVVDGRTHGVFPLHEDRVLTLSGRLGEAVVEIAGGRVRIASSECADHRWHAGWLAERGTLVCVPNRVLVEVRAGTETEPDAITR